MKEINNLIKNGQITEYTFFQKGHADGQQAYEKMLNTINHQGNENENHSEISFHICQKAIIKKKINNRCW